MNNNPIGILDSGVGGLSIWKEITALVPSESTIYIADSKNCPYGNRSEKEIHELSRKLVQFLINKNCKVVVVACNTITVSCLDKLRSEFKLPIIGTVPVVKTASEHSRNRKIGILSTTRTAESEYQKKLIEKFVGDCEAVNIGTDELVPRIERGEKEFPLKQVLVPFKKAGIDTLALGCSHFPLIRSEIQKELGDSVWILDSGPAIGRQTKRILENNDILSEAKKPRYEFYTTGNEEQFGKLIQLYGSNEVESIKQIKL